MKFGLAPYIVEEHILIYSLFWFSYARASRTIIIFFFNFDLHVSFRGIHHWVLQVQHGSKVTSLSIQFWKRLQRNWANLLHRLLFAGACKWVRACFPRVHMNQGSRRILMCLGGLYLKTCLLSFLTLSRQVVLFLIASVDSPYDHGS